MDCDALIRAVYDRPAIWNIRDKLHHDRLFVHQAWNAIAEELNCPVDAVRRKWKALRDSFRIELKKLQILPNSNDNSGCDSKAGLAPDGSTLTSNWPYFNDLLFLKGQVGTRKYNRYGCTDLLEESKAPETSDCDEGDNFSGVNPANFDMSNFVHTGEELQDIKRPRLSGEVDVGELLDIKNKYLELVSKTESEENDDKQFLMSLLPYLKNIRPKQKFEFRIKVMELIYNFNQFGE